MGGVDDERLAPGEDGGEFDDFEDAALAVLPRHVDADFLDWPTSRLPSPRRSFDDHLLPRVEIEPDESQPSRTRRRPARPWPGDRGEF